MNPNQRPSVRAIAAPTTIVAVSDASGEATIDCESTAPAPVRRNSPQHVTVSGRHGLSPAWAELDARLPNEQVRDGLIRLMRVASGQRVAPNEVSDAFLSNVLRSFRQEHPKSDAGRFQLVTVHLWNQAAHSVRGWPQHKLSVPVTGHREPQFPLSAFPDSFRADLEQYLRSLGNVFSTARSVCQPRTIKLRREQLRLAASTLAKDCGDPAQVTSLASLVAPAHTELILRAYLGRAPHGKPTEFIHGLLRALVGVARDWVHLPTEEVEVLKKLQSKLRKLGPISNGLTPKNRHLLQRLDDPAVRLRLLELPQALAKDARRAGLCPAWKLHKMRTAVAVELLLHTAMRMRNLAGLRVGHHLAWPDGPGGVLAINVPESETKNSAPLESELGASSKALVHEYLERFYPKVARHQPKPPLFIKLDGTVVSGAMLARGITTAIEREVDIDMTPHQFRHFAAALALDANPDAYPLVKDLLGHKKLQTTLAIYAGPRRRAAGRFWNGVLDRELARLKTQE